MNHQTPLELEQDVLRRRLRAARILANVTVAQLADRITPGSRLSQRTINKLEQGDVDLTAPVMRELAAALDLPYEWFTVPSIGDALAPQGSTRARLVELGDETSALREELERMWAVVSAGLPGREGRGQISQPTSNALPSPAGRPRSPRRSARP